ncbi:hypothetical protein POVCU2_0019170 [Plasmodium ovale curtisi]|uniref:Uncharacterized protein n=1 Tax=Plasmodium ovale curtisi TaxID=864141 RepID=A0A1A8WF28_PLAOA|nr:hypothetical protein POVCU2_0019170 [Plasmodium ovale curtisi]SBS89793.1 hypothetical protein POVCU1_017060 [Plasmodium ovale curtisi]
MRSRRCAQRCKRCEAGDVHNDVNDVKQEMCSTMVAIASSAATATATLAGNNCASNVKVIKLEKALNWGICWYVPTQRDITGPTPRYKHLSPHR